MDNKNNSCHLLNTHYDKAVWFQGLCHLFLPKTGGKDYTHPHFINEKIEILKVK